MKSTFIGSSHGVPEPNRKCTCIMIEAGSNVYFVDMGTSAIDGLRARNIPIDAVKGIFITHMHGDHTNGLIQFIDLITWYFTSCDPVVCLPRLEAARIIDEWLKLTMNEDEKDIRYLQTKAGVVFDDGVLKVTAIPTKHAHDAFAYLVEADGKKMLYTGDLANPKFDFPVAGLEADPDIVICESAHFPATDYAEVFDKYKPKKVCFTHYSDHFLGSVLTMCKELNDKGIPALRAADNFEFNV